MTATATKPDPLHALTAYQWEPQPKAAAFVRKVVDDFLDKLPEAKAFADRLYRETGNRFGDLIDTIYLGPTDAIVNLVNEAGWKPYVETCYTLYQNPCGMFPRIAIDGSADDIALKIDLKVESVEDFLRAYGKHVEILPEPNASFRWSCVAGDPLETCLGVAERHGNQDLDGRGDAEPVLEQLERWRGAFTSRIRSSDSSDDAFDGLAKLINGAIDTIGRDVACDLFFAAEREYWQRRNTAAQFQKARQDKLGIGWANHDHHTYRSSRRYFHRLVALWEKLGFECRERFYPGPEAGWGAQVMEQPVCGIVTFNDVDISEDEMLTDFAHEPMEDRTADNGGLATVGLWCALHGESVLQAGMHHLECTFDFAALEAQMKSEAGIETMPKFTDFPHLKQAFTKGERWAVDPQRIDALLSKRLITEHQAKEFRKHGAIGSHLENLERNDGFKGFNQTGVTDIIKRTDPRYAETR